MIAMKVIKTNIATDGYSIYHDLEIAASTSKVFEAISSPNLLINWWPLKCNGNPETGGEYNFYFTPEYDWIGTVVEYSVNSKFHVKMNKADNDWQPTTFGFNMEEAKGKVQLSFWHKGWQECNKAYRRSSFCWAILLNGLKNYIEKGVIIPFEERA